VSSSGSRTPIDRRSTDHSGDSRSITSPVALGTPAEVLTADNLRTAFGGRFVQVGDELILDDPHHHH